MKKITYLLLVLSIGFVSCEGSLDETYDELADPFETDSIKYTIISDDYEGIVPSNDEDFYHVNQAFLSEADALEKIPSIIESHFLSAPEKKAEIIFNVVSDEYAEAANNIDSLSKISTIIVDNSYILIKDDYSEDLATAFFPEVTESEITETILNIANNTFPDLKNGDIVNLTYSQYTEEPVLVKGDKAVDEFTYIFDNDSTNEWEIYDILGNVPEDVWVPSDEYDNIQASGFSEGSANENEDWLVSPDIDLSSIENPRAKITQAIRFAEGNLDLLEIIISEDFEGDVNLANWTPLEFENTPIGDSDDYFESDELDLSAYDNSTVNIAFRYRSTTDVSPRWRIENFTIIGGVDFLDADFQEVNTSFEFEDGIFTELSHIYRLTSQDYINMGTESGRPGEFGSFSNSVLLENYIPQLLEANDDYSFLQTGDIVFVGYEYFSGSTDSLFSPFIKQDGKWIEYNADNFLEDAIVQSSLSFVFDVELQAYILDAATPYTTGSDDYSLIVSKLRTTYPDAVDSMDTFGNFERRESSSAYWSDEMIAEALSFVLIQEFPDVEVEDLFQVTFDIYNGSRTTEVITLIYVGDEEFEIYVEEE